MLVKIYIWNNKCKNLMIKRAFYSLEKKQIQQSSVKQRKLMTFQPIRVLMVTFVILELELQKI